MFVFQSSGQMQRNKPAETIAAVQPAQKTVPEFQVQQVAELLHQNYNLMYDMMHKGASNKA